jgi:tetratricopeptide (TPR) repeat protein
LRDARRASNTGKWELTEAILSRYLRRFPEDAEAQILFARARAAQNDLQGCLTRLAGISDSSPWSAEARLCEAQAYQLSHFGARAEQSYRRAIDLAESEIGNEKILNVARVGLAQLCALEARPDEAREQIIRLLPATADPSALLAVLLEVEAVGPEPNPAIDSLKRFVENDPEDFEARRALAHHYAVVGRLSDARPLLENCLAERPDHARAVESLAHCLIEIPDLPAATELLQAAPVGSNQTAWYWRLRGYLAEQEQDWMAGVECYENAVRLAPYDSVMHHRLAAALGRLERAEKAEEHFERASTLRDGRKNLFDLYGRLMATGVRAGGPGPDTDLCYLIGNNCQILGLPEAREWFQLAIARDPRHAASRAALEQLEATAPKNSDSPVEGGKP